MATKPIPSGRLRFDDFELDVRAGQLRRKGVRLRLRGQPLQVLEILLERAGDVVTREELQSRIWPADTFVDFDHSLHNAIARIREVLGDSAENPRFIETLPRRGYRYIGPVEDSQAQPASAEKIDDAGEVVSLAPPGQRKSRVAVVVRAVILCAVLALGLIAWTVWRPARAKTSAASIHSLAVLPLSNMSGDPSQDYFADGMTEELITELARIQSLRVISHTSVMDYKGTKKHLPQIARELGVDAILEGSVIRESNNVRVTVQLLDGPADRHLWGEEYERPLNGVLNLQRDVGRAIAQEVRAKLSATQQTAARPAHVVNPAAYDDYLKGRFYFDNGYSKPDSLKKAQQYFEHSIQTDPNFAQPYAGLANTYIYSAFAGVLNRDWAYQSAKLAVGKALELDESVGEAHDTLATLKESFEWDWEGAERELNRAIALAPSYNCAHEDLANLLAVLGRRDEALAEIAKIDQLDFGYGSAGTEAGVYYSLQDYPNLIGASKRVQLLDPNDGFSHYSLGVAYEGTGKLQDAISEYQKVMEINGDPNAAVGLARAYSAMGKKTEAQKILHDLERKLHGTDASPYVMATIYAGLGDKDQAFAFLNRAFRERSFQLSSDLRGNPSLDRLRNDPRFRTLLSQMGLPSQ